MSPNPCRNAFRRSFHGSGDSLPSSPMIGIFDDCCARAATVQVATAPPTTPKTSRRFIGRILPLTTTVLTKADRLEGGQRPQNACFWSEAEVAPWRDVCFTLQSGHRMDIS